MLSTSASPPMRSMHMLNISVSPPMYCLCEAYTHPRREVFHPRRAVSPGSSLMLHGESMTDRELREGDQRRVTNVTENLVP